MARETLSVSLFPKTRGTTAQASCSHCVPTARFARYSIPTVRRYSIDANARSSLLALSTTIIRVRDLTGASKTRDNGLSFAQLLRADCAIPLDIHDRRFRAIFASSDNSTIFRRRERAKLTFGTPDDDNPRARLTLREPKRREIRSVFSMFTAAFRSATDMALAAAIEFLEI